MTILLFRLREGANFSSLFPCILGKKKGEKKREGGWGGLWVGESNRKLPAAGIHPKPKTEAERKQQANKTTSITQLKRGGYLPNKLDISLWKGTGNFQ